DVMPTLRARSQNQFSNMLNVYSSTSAGNPEAADRTGIAALAGAAGVLPWSGLARVRFGPDGNRTFAHSAAANFAIPPGGASAIPRRLERITGLTAGSAQCAGAVGVFEGMAAWSNSSPGIRVSSASPAASHSDGTGWVGGKGNDS